MAGNDMRRGCLRVLRESARHVLVGEEGPEFKSPEAPPAAHPARRRSACRNDREKEQRQLRDWLTRRIPVTPSLRPARHQTGDGRRRCRSYPRTATGRGAGHLEMVAAWMGSGGGGSVGGVARHGATPFHREESCRCRDCLRRDGAAECAGVALLQRSVKEPRTRGRTHAGVAGPPPRPSRRTPPWSGRPGALRRRSR